jgi:8-oxo-dGTP pyrophosphatase MutT (NUDIX family)
MEAYLYRRRRGVPVRGSAVRVVAVRGGRGVGSGGGVMPVRRRGGMDVRDSAVVAVRRRR